MRGQTAGRSACGRDQPQTAVAGGVRSVSIAKIGDAPSVRRPGWQRADAIAGRDPYRFAALDVHHKDVRSAVVVAVGMAGGDEGQTATIGRPGRLGVVPITLGELTCRATGSVNDQQVAAAVVRKTLTVVAILEGGDEAGRRRFGLVAVLRAPLLLAPRAYHADESRAIGRPYRRASTLGNGAQLPGLTASDVHHVHLRLATVTVREEGQACAIGRPAWGAILAPATRKAFGWGGAVCGHDPDVGAIVVCLLIQTGDGKGQRAPIGCDARVGYPLHTEQVCGNHATGHMASYVWEWIMPPLPTLPLLGEARRSSPWRGIDRWRWTGQFEPAPAVPSCHTEYRDSRGNAPGAGAYRVPRPG